MTTQTRIEGTEPTTFPDVNRAAEQFLEARQGAKNSAENVKRAQIALIGLMRKHGLTTYRDPLEGDDGLVIELDEKDVVKVTKARKPRKPRRRG
jgi:hypothetical protein